MNMMRKPEALEILRDLQESGKLTPVIGRAFALREIVAAMQCMQDGNTVGRLIIAP